MAWTSDELLAALPEAWRGAAWVLLATWEDAVRVSSAVERWHSILRPHLAVRRTLTTGGMTDAPTAWLVALGYPPDEAVTPRPGPLAQAA